MRLRSYSGGMTTPPSQTLTLHDASGVAFGHLRLSPSEEGSSKGDCIFDITPSSPEQGARAEVRWLGKRDHRRCGELRFKMADDGKVSATMDGFTFALFPDEEGGLKTHPPAPKVFAHWA